MRDRGLTCGSQRALGECFLPVLQQRVLGSDCQKTVIFPAELLAIVCVCALKVWLNVLSSRPVVFFVDNNCARDVCISASGRAAVIRALLQVLLKDEENARVFPWYQRVPSPSNPSDEPSSKKCSHVSVGGRQTIRCTDVCKAMKSIFFELEANKGKLS